MKKLVLFSILAVAGHTVTAQSLNGTFETWRNYSAGIINPVPLEAPQGWYGLDSLLCAVGPLASPSGSFSQQVFKSTDKHGGTYAVKLMTKPLDGGAVFGTFPGIISNSPFAFNLATQELELPGGTPVTQRVTSVSTWIKHMPNSPDDSGEVDVMAVLSGQGAGGKDSIVGENYAYFGAMSNYTLVNVPVIYNSPTVVPDKIIVSYASSDFTNPTDSTSMYVDDATMTTASGVQLPVFNQDVVSCHPNPSSGTLYLTNKTTAPLTWEAFNARGQVIAASTFSGQRTVDLTNTPAGVYFFRVKDGEGHLLQTGKFTLRP